MTNAEICGVRCIHPADEERFDPLLTKRLRAKRRGKAGTKWHADETFVKVDRRWCYLYRAIDADGNLVDSPYSAGMEHAMTRQGRDDLARHTKTPRRVVGPLFWRRSCIMIVGPKE